VVEEAFDLEGALEDELLDVDVVVVVVVVGVLTTTGTAGVSGKLQAPLEKT
jgi:hypothetical protein